MFNTDYKEPWNVRLLGPIAETKGQRERREEAECAAKVKLSYSAPASDALLLNGKLVVSESVRKQGDVVAVRVVPVAGTTDLKSQFQSNAASQWSTTEPFIKRKISGHVAFESPILRTGEGKLVLGYDKRALRKDIKAVKYLAKNRKVIKWLIKNRKIERQQRMDAAMFM
jgi:hypothetical protein